MVPKKVVHYGFTRGHEQPIGRTTRALAHQAFERVAMNTVKLKKLFDQTRRMVDSGAQLADIKRRREHRVFNYTA